MIDPRRLARITDPPEPIEQVTYGGFCLDRIPRGEIHRHRRRQRPYGRRISASHDRLNKQRSSPGEKSLSGLLHLPELRCTHLTRHANMIKSCCNCNPPLILKRPYLVRVPGFRCSEGGPGGPRTRGQTIMREDRLNTEATSENACTTRASAPQSLAVRIGVPNIVEVRHHERPRTRVDGATYGESSDERPTAATRHGPDPASG